MQKVPIPKLQSPVKGRSCRAVISRPAKSTMPSAASPVQSGEVYPHLEYFPFLLTISLALLAYAVQG